MSETNPVCPRCHQNESWQVLPAPTHAWLCGGCHSHMLTAQGTQALAAQVGIDAHMLPELAHAQGRPSELQCPTGHGPMYSVPLRGGDIRVCLQCAVSVLEPGQLEAALSGAPLPAGQMSGAHAVAPGPAAPIGDAHAPVGDAPARPAAAAPAGQLFAGLERIGVHQQTAGIELLGFEAANAYSLDLGPRGHALAAEDGGGAKGTVMRQVLGGLRPLRLTITDDGGAPYAICQRAFSPLFSSMEVNAAASGQKIGAIRRRFRLFGKRYDLESSSGRVFATADAGPLRVRKFTLKDANGQPLGAVQKRFGGVAQEMFTDADNFEIDLSGASALSEAERAVVVATALSIDLDHFEKSSSRSSAVKIVSGLLVVGLWLFGSMCGGGGGGDDDEDAFDDAHYPASEGLRGLKNPVPVFPSSEVVGRQNWDRMQMSANGAQRFTRGFRWVLRFEGDGAAVESFYDQELGCGPESATAGRSHRCSLGTKAKFNTHDIEYEYQHPDAPGVRVEVELDLEDHELEIYENVPAASPSEP